MLGWRRHIRRITRLRWLFDEFCLDSRRRELSRQGQPVRIEPQVFDLLEFLLLNRDRLVTRDDLIASVWDGRIVSESALATRINAARAAIGDSGDRQRLIKTIPRKGLRFVAEVREEPATAAPAAGPPRDAPEAAPPERPSVVVLPFANLSGDPEQDYFADGMTEELTTALSRLRWFFVIARGSAFTYKGRAVDVRQVGRELGASYVVEGSVRKAAGQVRVTCRLAEAGTAHEVWGDRFDGDVADIFGLQDRVAEAVVAALEPSLREAEVERARRKPTASLGAYDLYLRALPHYYALSAEGFDQALGLLRRALVLDPDFAPAAALASFCMSYRTAQGRAAPGETEEAVRLARHAVATRPTDPVALAWAANTIGYSGLDTDAAYAVIGRALATSPNSVEACATGGYVCCWLCRPEEALGHLGRAIRLSPMSPELPRMMGAVALAHLVAGRLDAALDAAQTAVRNRPDFSEGHRFVVIALAMLGRLEEARAAALRFRGIFPRGATVQAARTRRLFSDQAFAEARIVALRDAGLPE